MQDQTKSALFAVQSMFHNQQIKINAVVTKTSYFYLCNMGLLQGESSVKKIVHRAFRISTDGICRPSPDQLSCNI